MRIKITKRRIDELVPGGIVADDEVRGFVARKLASGAVTYGFRYRDKKANKQRWIGLGLHGSITAEQARTLAKKRAGEVADGRDPAAELELAREKAAMDELIAANTVNVLIDSFLKEYVRGPDPLRSANQIEKILDTYVRPRIGDNSIYDLRRSDIQKMLAEIAKQHGPVMADRVLAYVRKAFNWRMIDDDNFKSPIVRGMARTKPKQRARKRTLSDEELCDVWSALETAEVPECYPRFVKSLLFNAARRNEAANMHSTEVERDLWTISGERYKTKLDHVLPLTDIFRQLIGEKPDECRGNSWFVFSTTHGARPFSGFSKAKKALDIEISRIRDKSHRSAIPRWTLHDLRRTGRSLMSRAKVTSDHAERVLGHVIGGVRETYDRYEYLDEKRDALNKLSQIIHQILQKPEVSSLTAVESRAAA